VSDPEEPAPDTVSSLPADAASRLIVDIASAAAGGRDLDQILHETLDRLRSVAPLTGGSIALVEGDELVIRAAVGPFATEALGQRLPRGPSASWSVIDTLEPRNVSDLRQSGYTIKGAEASGAIRSWLAVPIVRRGAGIGLLEIDSTVPDAFGPAEVDILQTIVRILAGPVELADILASERRAAELRDAFIGVVSHELRTPITTIYGLSKTVRQHGRSLDPDVFDRAIEDIEAEADRLHRLVEDLLVLSRAERGAVEVTGEPIGLGRVLRRLVLAETGRLTGRRIELAGEAELPLVVGEETYVEQVVRNLITNAAKYSDPSTVIRVAAAAVDGEVVVRVLDEGIGMTEQDQAHAFELFYRSSSASRLASGAGIGLFVCRQLVEAMGGRIWVRRQESLGTEVGFALPALRPEDVDPE
jgi:signal transduction histidine kinase